MGNVRQRCVLSVVGAKPRKFWLMAASCLAPLSLGVSEPALAQCSALDVNGNATCSSGTYTNTTPQPPGTFPAPINYNTDNGLGGTRINLTLLPGVNVILPAGPGGFNAVNTNNTGGVTTGSANIAITADSVTINNTFNPSSNNNTGLRIQSSGNAIINATNTTINVAGTGSDWAILAFAQPQIGNLGAPHMASVSWSGPGLTSTSGVEGGAIQADNRGNGDAIVVASGGTINVVGVGGTTQYGLLAHAGDLFTVSSGAGNASVTFNSGTLNVNADPRPRGILAWVGGDGSATATTAAGTVINVSGTQLGGPGVYVFRVLARPPRRTS
jgi:hypothetical protein